MNDERRPKAPSETSTKKSSHKSIGTEAASDDNTTDPLGQMVGAEPTWISDAAMAERSRRASEMIAESRAKVASRARPVTPTSPNLDDDGGDANKASQDNKKSQSTVLVEMGLASYSFGRSDDGEPFAVPNEGPQVARLLRGSSESLRAELSRKYFGAHGIAARQAALADAMNTLHGFALESEPVELLLRVGQHQGSHYLDLGDATGQAVCIRPGLGWEVVDRSPLLFRRNEATGVLPAPVSGGSLDDLWRFVNVPLADRPVVLAVLVAMLIPDIPHPIVFLLGEAGTGKTNATKTLASLVDPSTAQVRKPPRDDESWITQASASWCIPIDNVTRLSPWLSDSLCRASTGDGDIRRRLYTDAGVKVFSHRRCIILTGIDIAGIREDLADRACTIHLQRITDRAREDENRLQVDWQKAQPGIIGALLDLAVKVLALRGDIAVSPKPRMLDFARVLASVDAVLATGGLDRYREMASQVAAESIEADPVLDLLRRATYHLIAAPWQGTSAELLDLLTVTYRAQQTIRPENFPKDAREVARLLRTAAPALRQVGWTVDDLGRVGHDNAIRWRIEPPK